MDDGLGMSVMEIKLNIHFRREMHRTAFALRWMQ